MSKNFLLKKKHITFIHKIYLCQKYNLKNHTASTKTKGEVRGGGRKPWKQKGTGNARAGSIRSPLWKGGGVIFGPKPYFAKKKINKKERKLSTALAFFIKRKSFKIFSNASIEMLKLSHKSQNFVNAFKKENISFGKNLLLVLDTYEINDNILRASKNIKKVFISSYINLSLLKILAASKIIFSEKAFNLANKKFESYENV